MSSSKDEHTKNGQKKKNWILGVIIETLNWAWNTLPPALLLSGVTVIV